MDMCVHSSFDGCWICVPAQVSLSLSLSLIERDCFFLFIEWPGKERGRDGTRSAVNEEDKTRQCEESEVTRLVV